MSGSQSHRTERRNTTKKRFTDRFKLIKTMKGDKRSSSENFPTLSKARNCKRNIFSFPIELLTDVLARVAASSFCNFFHLKLSCKAFYHIASDKYVLQHVSLDKVPFISWSPSAKQKQAVFLEQCKKSMHPEVLFREGVVNYFSFSKVEEGVNSLRSAGKVGHLVATYVLGVILLCAEEPDQEQEGRRLLSYVRSEKSIKESRRKLKDITKFIWLNNFLEPKPNRCLMQYQHSYKIRQGWQSDEEDDVNCKACECDLEITFVCNLLRGVVTY